MKNFLVIVVLAVLVVFFLRHGAGNKEQKGDASIQAAATPDGSNYFKRPLDRTHEVIDQVKKQRREDNY
jgi:hypothetical protein